MFLIKYNMQDEIPVEKQENTKILEGQKNNEPVILAVEDIKIPVEVILENMGIENDTERFNKAKALLEEEGLGNGIKENPEIYKDLIIESHKHGKEDFPELYQKEIDENYEMTEAEKSKIKAIRIGKAKILLEGKDGVKISRKEVEVLLDNGIAGFLGIFTAIAYPFYVLQHIFYSAGYDIKKKLEELEELEEKKVDEDAVEHCRAKYNEWLDKLDTEHDQREVKYQMKIWSDLFDQAERGELSHYDAVN